MAQAAYARAAPWRSADMTRRLSEQIHTPCLLLRRPRLDGAEAVFMGWASDPVATRYLS